MVHIHLRQLRQDAVLIAVGVLPSSVDRRGVQSHLAGKQNSPGDTLGGAPQMQTR